MKGIIGNNRGLTLLELLIAVAISAVILTVVYQTFNGIMASAARIEEAAEVDQMARISLGLMTREIRSVFWKPAGNNGEWSELKFNGSDGISGGAASDSLVFTAFSPLVSKEGTVTPNLSVLSYNLSPTSREEEFFLMHSENTNPLGDSPGLNQQYEMAERVSGLNFRFFDGEEWQDDWDAAVENKLPKAVEIQLYFRTSDGEESRYTTAAHLPMSEK